MELSGRKALCDTRKGERCQKKRTLHVLLWTSIHIIHTVSHNDDVFTRDTRFSDILPNKDILWNSTNLNRIRCGQLCLLDENCTAIFTRNAQCYGYSKRIHDSTSTKVELGMRYYELKGLYGNVAAGKPSTQSSTWVLYTGTYDAAQANDGLRRPLAFAPGDSCSNTDANQPPHWWRVDLQKSYTITAVSILSRNDTGFENNVAGLVVEIGANENSNFQECNRNTDGWVGEFVDFRCTPNPIPGRYVKVSRPIDNTQTITLCEVEVYGI